MKNLYEVAEIVEAGSAHKLIQSLALPGKTHKFIYECDTCIEKVWVAEPF